MIIILFWSTLSSITAVQVNLNDFNLDFNLPLIINILPLYLLRPFVSWRQSPSSQNKVFSDARFGVDVVI
jgi:hypothetical protein